jgi:hypothetical protein
VHPMALGLLPKSVAHATSRAFFGSRLPIDQGAGWRRRVLRLRYCDSPLAAGGDGSPGRRQAEINPKQVLRIMQAKNLT